MRKFKTTSNRNQEEIIIIVNCSEISRTGKKEPMHLRSTNSTSDINPNQS
jgi:ribosomal protein L13